MMKVLDLFSGKEGWSRPFAKRGHETFTVEWDEQFEPDLCIDIRRLKVDMLPWQPDIVLASPPCEMFSTGGWHQHSWQFNAEETKPSKRYVAMDDKARMAASLVRKTVRIIEELQPTFFIIENPKALLRKLGLIPFERRTVWYCHYGELRAKPTDLWGGFPPSLKLHPECHRLWPQHPDDCCCHDHIPAPRGSITGTQGMATADAAMIPRPLALAICKAAERDI